MRIKKNSKSAVPAYNQLCSSTTVLVISLVRINHKDPCLEVDINILFFTGVDFSSKFSGCYGCVVSL